MRATIVITTFLLTIGFGALIHSQAAELMAEKPGKSLRTNPSSSPFQIVDGELLKVDGEFYVLEDPAGKERRREQGNDITQWAETARRYHSSRNHKRPCHFYSMKGKADTPGGGTGFFEDTGFQDRTVKPSFLVSPLLVAPSAAIYKLLG